MIKIGNGIGAGFSLLQIVFYIYHYFKFRNDRPGEVDHRPGEVEQIELVFGGGELEDNQASAGQDNEGEHNQVPSQGNDEVSEGEDNRVPFEGEHNHVPSQGNDEVSKGDDNEVSEGEENQVTSQGENNVVSEDDEDDEMSEGQLVVEN